MAIKTPAEYLAFWNDVDARVDDEVERIQKLLDERRPGTRHPACEFVGGSFCIPMVWPFDPEFMKLVLERFRVAGWTVYLAHTFLMLKSPVLQCLQNVTISSDD